RIHDTSGNGEWTQAREQMTTKPRYRCDTGASPGATLTGLEPATSAVTGRRAGRPLRRATRNRSSHSSTHRNRWVEDMKLMVVRRTTVVARAGIEPATFRFSGGRSYQLSYLAGRHPNRMPIETLERP